MNKNAQVVVNALIQEAENTGLTGAQKKEYVNYKIIGIVKGFFPVLNIIPTSLIDEGMDFCENKVVDELKQLLPTIGDFIENCFKKLFHKV